MTDDTFDAAEWSVTHDLMPGPTSDIAVDVLTGGVSCEVLSVSRGDNRIVVKRARPFLAVADAWPAPLRRVNHEADVAGLLGEITPEHVPPILINDRDRHVIAMSHAPNGWVPWKQQLLEGAVDVEAARTLGTVAGSWHRDTWDSDAAAAVDDYELFEYLRIDPYFITMRSHCPGLEEAITGLVERLRATRVCLVHGDFSPKNVLVGPDGLWVIDHEVGHLGDPTFDLGFMLHHLLLKAIHRPTDASRLRVAAEAFLQAYEASGAPAHDDTWTTQVTGGLVIARVRGKSLAEYLTSGEQDRAYAQGAMMLTTATSLTEAWDRLLETA